MIMKTKSILAGLVILLSAAFTTHAQLIEPAVKILPGSEKGQLKVIYAYNSQNAVDVKFLGENGLLKSDRIQAGSFTNGFSKRYDVSRIKAKSFWIEVSSADLSVRYKMIESKDGKFVPYLEKTTINHPMVAAIN